MAAHLEEVIACDAGNAFEDGSHFIPADARATDELAEFQRFAPEIREEAIQGISRHVHLERRAIGSPPSVETFSGAIVASMRAF